MDMVQGNAAYRNAAKRNEIVRVSNHCDGYACVRAFLWLDRLEPVCLCECRAYVWLCLFPSHNMILNCTYMVCVYTKSYILCMLNRLQPVVASYRLTVDVI